MLWRACVAWLFTSTELCHACQGCKRNGQGHSWCKLGLLFLTFSLTLRHSSRDLAPGWLSCSYIVLAGLSVVYAVCILIHSVLLRTFTCRNHMHPCLLFSTGIWCWFAWHQNGNGAGMGSKRTPSVQLPSLLQSIGTGLCPAWSEQAKWRWRSSSRDIIFLMSLSILFVGRICAS